MVDFSLLVLPRLDRLEAFLLCYHDDYKFLAKLF